MRGRPGRREAGREDGGEPGEESAADGSGWEGYWIRIRRTEAGTSDVETGVSQGSPAELVANVDIVTVTGDAARRVDACHIFESFRSTAKFL
jgi:hypothetical protein